MEIKTCEQYVLKKLEDAENEVEQLKQEALDMSDLMVKDVKRVKEVTEEFDKICSILEKYGTIKDDKLIVEIPDDNSDFDYLYELCVFSVKEKK